MIVRCPGCHMTNSTITKKNIPLYAFPIDAHFRTVHIDIYSLGKTEPFDGYKSLYIVLDHMTALAVIQPVQQLNSDSFLNDFMKILLQHGLCHTEFIDADSKFKATFSEMIDKLQLNKYELSKGNHQAMLVERFNKYLNKTMKIFTNERGTNKYYVQGALLFAYAWNSSPVSGTDISRSLLVLGREFQFPIDFATDNTFSTNNSPKIVSEYTTQSREINKILIEEHRVMHRELRNSEIKNEREFRFGDIVFARRQVQSNKQKGIVDKSQFASTGPWRVIVNNKNGSYEIQHIKTNKIEKRHASLLELSPSNFLQRKPLLGADHSYSTIHKDVRPDRFHKAGITEEPAGTQQQETMKISAIQVFASAIADGLPNFPSLHELNQEYNTGFDIDSHTNSSYIGHSQEYIQGPPGNNTVDTYTIALDPRPENLKMQPYILVPKIIASTDKLFFISFEEKNKTGASGGSYNSIFNKQWKKILLLLQTVVT